MAVGISSRIRVAGCSLLLFFVALFLSAYSDRNPQAGQFGRLVVTEVAGPIFSVFEAARRGITSVVENYVALVGAKRENTELKTQLEQLKKELVSTEEMRFENQRLRALLGVAAQQNVQGVSASVIGSTPSGWANGIIINRGSSHGVLAGMAVVSAEGVVGQVVSSSPHGANVILLTDHSSGVDALTQEGRVRGVVGGEGARKCAFRYVRREESVRVGDVIVTSGMDGVYPKGLMVGRVSGVEEAGGALFKEIAVAPAVDFSRLEEVLVVTASPPTSPPVKPSEKGPELNPPPVAVKEKKR